MTWVLNRVKYCYGYTHHWLKRLGVKEKELSTLSSRQDPALRMFKDISVKFKLPYLIYILVVLLKIR